jgi:hypothetical protein
MCVLRRFLYVLAAIAALDCPDAVAQAAIEDPISRPSVVYLPRQSAAPVTVTRGYLSFLGCDVRPAHCGSNSRVPLFSSVPGIRGSNSSASMLRLCHPVSRLQNATYVAFAACALYLLPHGWEMTRSLAELQAI